MIGDKLHLQQVLFNLLTNAAKFAPEKSVVTVTVAFEKKTERLFISVVDTGPGLSEGQLKELFKPFMIVKNKKTDRLNPYGVGLGLHVS